MTVKAARLFRVDGGTYSSGKPPTAAPYVGVLLLMQPPSSISYWQVATLVAKKLGAEGAREISTRVPVAHVNTSWGLY